MHPNINTLEKSKSPGNRSVVKSNRMYQALSILNKLLYISLENISLRAVLEQFIDEISALSWLALESKGAIFLVGEEPEVLKWKPSEHLTHPYSRSALESLLADVYAVKRHC